MNAGTEGFDPQGDVRHALAAVVRDHGPAILADSRQLGGVLNILLPTAPEETAILVAAARAGTSAQLARQAATLGPDAAVEAVSAGLAQSGVLDPRSGRWAVGEIARALGFPVSDPGRPAAALGGPAAWPALGPDPTPLPAAPAPPPAAAAGLPPQPAPYAPPPPLAWPPTPPAAPSPFTPPSAPAAFAPPSAPAPFPAPPAPAPFPFASPGVPSPVAPPLPPSGFTPPAPASFGGPGAPASFAGAGAPPPSAVPGGPPQGPQWAGARPPAPAPPGGPPGGPPPWAPPRGSQPSRHRPLALIAAIVVVVLLVGYAGVAAIAGLPPFRAAASPTPVAGTTSTPTPAPTATIVPSSSPTTSPAGPSSTPSPSLSPLSSLLPTYITGNASDSCSDEPSDAYVASGESGEELCDLTENNNVEEDYVLYAGFPTEEPATAYFASLLTANGMKATQGNCQNVTLVADADGSSQYCENSYTTSTSSGSDFVFTGSPNFEMGNGNPVSSLDLCSDVNSVDVLGFTDPTYAAVGIAISCVGSEEDQQVDSDFLAGDFFLGS